MSGSYSVEVSSHSSLPSKQNRYSPCEWQPVTSVGAPSVALLVDEVVCATTDAAVAAIKMSWFERMVVNVGLT